MHLNDCDESERGFFGFLFNRFASRYFRRPLCLGFNLNYAEDEGKSVWAINIVVVVDKKEDLDLTELEEVVAELDDYSEPKIQFNDDETAMYVESCLAGWNLRLCLTKTMLHADGFRIITEPERFSLNAKKQLLDTGLEYVVFREDWICHEPIEPITKERPEG